MNYCPPGIVIEQESPKRCNVNIVNNISFLGVHNCDHYLGKMTGFGEN